MKFFINIIMCLVCFMELAFAEVPTVVIKDSNFDYDITNYVESNEYSVDAEWPWETINHRWHKYDNNYLQPIVNILPIDKNVKWFRVTLDNRIGDSTQLVFSINNTFIDQVDFFIRNSAGQLTKVWHSGLSRGLSSKYYPSTGWDFPIFLSNHEYKTIYIRLEASLATHYNFRAVDYKRYNHIDVLEKILCSCTAGLMFIIMVTSLVLGLFLKEKQFLKYGILSFAIFLCLGVIGNCLRLSSEMLPNSINILKIYILSTFIMLFGFVSIFKVSFSQLNSKFMRNMANVFCIAYCIAAVVIWFVPEYVGLLFSVICNLLVVINVIYYIARLINSQDYIRLGYVSTALLFLLGELILSLSLMGVLDNESLARLIFCIVSFVLGISVSIGLGYWAYKERQYRDEIQHESEDVSNKLGQLLRSTSVGVFTLSTTGKFDKVNQSFLRIVGYNSLNEMHFSNFSRLCKVPEEFEDLLVAIIKKSQGLSPEELQEKIEQIKGERQLQLVTKDGKNITVRLILSAALSLEKIVVKPGKRPEKVRDFFFIGEITDLSQDEDYLNQVKYLESHDLVTGVYNRRYLITKLKELLQKDDQITGYLCFIRIRNLNYINDVAGHEYGDQFLLNIADFIKKHSSPDYEIVRLNGNEFAVLMSGSYITEALTYANTWRVGISSLRLEHNGNIFVITMNIGLVLIRDAKNNISNLLSLTDSACRTASQLGPNTVHLFTSPNENKVLPNYSDVVSKITNIHQSLDDNRIFCVKQKIVSNTSSDVCYELFTRLKDKDGEIIEPSSFIDVSAGFNVMPRIDDWMFKQVLGLFESNTEFFTNSERIFVNISCESICDNDFVDHLHRILSNNISLANALCFELDEKEVSSHFDLVLNFIKNFNNMGLCFSIDNFGSSGSSGYTLKMLNFSYVKLSPTFTHNINIDASNKVIVKSLIDMAKGLNIKTIAVKIEDEKDLMVLKELGVDYCQGRAVSKPEEIETVL